MSEILRDAHGYKIGTIETSGNKQILHDAHGYKLGEYDGRVTRDAHGYKVGEGNLLAMLLHR